MVRPYLRPVSFDHEPIASDHSSAYIGGGDPPGGGDMEARVSRLEDTFAGVKEALSRMEGRLDAMGADLSGVRVSQAKVEERLDRIVSQAESSSKSIGEVKVEVLTIGMKASGIATDVSKMPDKDWVHMRCWAVLGGIGVLLAIFKYVLPT